ncbi:hypothetical protein VVD49_02705 [Uliginosibacterium sp. H3]|uniref:Uncharacterized protein n=1 Tax=Uliginosibacterium silvisoli TaxID=3114758 RepID=A0ABU6K0J4_9RHOO|nr:hypothetical protein [Uliginosibacterium sp. H3]
MKDSKRVRQLRKQALCLQARHYRLALRHEWSGIAEPFASKGGSADSRHLLGIFGGLMSVLPSKWGRILSIGVLSWRLLTRLGNSRST